MIANNKKKKISFVLYSPFPNYSGGRETWLFNIIKKLNSRGFDITIYTFKDDSYNIFFDIEKMDNVNIIKCYTLESIKVTKFISRSYLGVVNRLMFGIQVFWKAVRSNDVYYIALGPITESLPIRALKRIKPHVKHICSIRGLQATELSNTFPLLKNIWYNLEKRNIQKSDLTICNGYDTQEYVMKLGFKSKVIPNGVDYNYYKNNEEDYEDSASFMGDLDSFYLLSTATIQDIKGIPTLIKSLNILKKSTSCDIRVIWVGKGDVNAYNKQIDEFKLSKMIVFTGERKNTAEFLRKANVVLCLSGGGGMSMAALEAMAAGKIIIAWDTPIYRQLIQNEHSGLLVEEHNHEELAEKIKYVASNYEHLFHLGANAQEIAKKFDWEEITNQLLEKLENIEK